MSEVRSTVEYRPIPGHPDYMVGSDGSVFRRLKCARTRRGYFRITLCTGRKDERVRRWLHHLVLEAFVGPRPEGMQACHYPDHNPANNCRENLRWDTPKGNAGDRLKSGRYDPIRGSKHYKAKLDDEAVRAIRAARAAGERLAVIAARYGISDKLVSLIARRKIWKWLP